MPTMIERLAERLLKESLEHGYYLNGKKLWCNDELILESDKETCIDRMRELIADIYARAVLDEMSKPDAAMLWVKSKGYDAMIEAALK